VSIGAPACGPDEILAAVAAQQAVIEQLLVELVAARTVLGSERGGQQVMLRALGELDLRVRELALDAGELRAHPAASPFSWDVTPKFNVLADWGVAQGEGGRSLILCGHIDVVSPEPSDMWASAPFLARRDGDWLYGRGAGDMKAGLAAIVGAVAGLQSLDLEPLAPVQIHSVVEEECTGNGALQCVLDGARADAVIITEPTDLAIQNSQVGVLWFQVVVRGTPAHAGSAPVGSNAIEACVPLLAALHALEAEMNADPPPPFDGYEHPINLNVGIIRGGDWASTVPAECVLHCRIADFPGERVAQLKQRVEAAVARAAEEMPEAHVSVRYDGFACEGYTLEGDAPLVGALADAAMRVTGAAPAVFASTATTDARSYYLNGNTPAVCFGPVAEAIHAIDERVLMPSVLATAQTLALFISDWCGLAPSRRPQ
jgi:acetylornithine deacetylase